MKIAIVCAPGIGDALIMHIASHHLGLAGFEVVTDTPHRFGKWLDGYAFGHADDCDAILLQHDNKPKSFQIHAIDKPIYTFYGSHNLEKHGALRIGFDYVCDPNRTMVDNVATSLQTLFEINANLDNGLKPPHGLIYRKHPKRVAIHASSSSPDKNWPGAKFLKVAGWLEMNGYEPVFLPHFPTLEDLTSYIYESGFFLGNDSGPGHIASCLKIPHLIIGANDLQMRLWRPGWHPGEVVVPSKWAPKTHWKSFVTARNVINRFKNNVLCN
jgi:ADP-heptose:LPS heptosyltransferase